MHNASCELRRTLLPSTRVYGAFPGTGSSPIHRRVVNFIGPGRWSMGRTDQGLLRRRIVLREGLAARLVDSCSIGRGYAAQLRRIPLLRTPLNKGKKPRGRDPVEPRPVTQIVDALLVTHLHCRRTSMRRHYLSKPTWRPRCSDASFPPDARRRASIRTLVGPAMRTGCMMGFVLWGPALLSR